MRRRGKSKGPQRTKGQHIPRGGRIGPETRALIWTLTEEGLSLRAVAEELGLGSHSTVQHELAKDPIRHESIETRLRAQRADKYAELADKGLELTRLWLDEGLQVAKGGLGKVKTSTLGKLSVLPRLIEAGSRTAERSTRAGELLAGRPTERVENAVDLSEDPDALIENAIDSGIVSMLPPPMRVEAERRMAERAKKP